MNPIFVYTINDIITAGLVVAAVGFYAAGAAIELFTQWRCKHDEGVRETRACDAICRKCGKNLGFIGSWRKRQ